MGRALHDGRDAARAGGSRWTFQFCRNQSNQGRGGYATLHILISYKPTLAITHEHNINCSGPKVPNTNLLQPDCGFRGEPDDLLLIGAALAWQEDGGGQAGTRASVFFFSFVLSGTVISFKWKGNAQKQQWKRDCHHDFIVLSLSPGPRLNLHQIFHICAYADIKCPHKLENPSVESFIPRLRLR